MNEINYLKKVIVCKPNLNRQDENSKHGFNVGGSTFKTNGQNSFNPNSFFLEHFNWITISTFIQIPYDSKFSYCVLTNYKFIMFGPTPWKQIYRHTPNSEMYKCQSYSHDLKNIVKY